MFSSYLVAFGFWSSTPPDNITLNPAHEKADDSLSEFQTGIGVASYAILYTEQLISDTRVAFVDTIYSLQDLEGVISILGVHELLTKIHDILDNCCFKTGWEDSSYFSTFLIMLPGPVVKFGLHSFNFFTVSRTQFLLVRLTFMAIYVSGTGSATFFLGIISAFSCNEWQSQTKDWVPFPCAKETCVRV